MTTAEDTGDAGAERRSSWLADLRGLLDRPLTSYHLIVGVSGLLLALGIAMVLSASSYDSLETYGNSYTMALRQLMWVAAGIPLAFVATRLPLRLLRAFTYPMLIVAFVLLVLTFTPLGVEINGNRNWLRLGGPFMMQPSEAAKLALVLWGADVLARKEKLLQHWKHLVIPFVPGAGLVLALVLGQRDLGTALVLFSLVLVLLFVVGTPLRYFAMFVGVVGLLVTYLAITSAYRMRRLMSFMDPFADYSNSGWQAAHSLFGLGTGGWWGVGIGNSREKWGWLPEAHTDFIYAVIGEELGLVGTLVVLGMFLTLAYVGIRVALRTEDTFTRLATAGIVGWITAQALVNMGAVLGLLPIAGIPLPLVSYGGSAMLPTLFALGLLVSFARREPAARAALDERSANRAASRAAARARRKSSARHDEG
ncbi:cell division protein FtsW [Actinopolymorpha cephalotaxi]|uniref:Probable peptidoglycan glycosyltransferase FtsW n=1 Tax=Actinopolymorpha cephalotaxi TaxID=504797 RepID=A0A1I2W9B4_9ACTN|nr:putative lipid II flippase FtsW [Actinopolymorpha cephalotaxi]NYH82685.1 cell division protein FtsW [Actinopolymorpha cephalotaxi]SFG97983.1 cell division protein FtsW [Actinopolymorpha cephalotaxi]